MDNIISMTFSEFSNLIALIIRSIRDDLFFPTGPRTVEEQVGHKIRGQTSMILSQQDQILQQTGVVQELNRQISDLKDLIDRKDNEIERLNSVVKSFEF
jgi:predicted RNase H-like nuclease (RuvC/YqgF family)